MEKGTLMDKGQKQKTNMKGIIRILIVALAVAGADVNGWMAMAQEKQISGMEQGAQKTPDHNDILRSCKELRRSGEFKKAVDEGIRYIAAGGEDSLAVVMDVLTTDVEYSEAILRGKISGDPGNIILWRAILSLFYSQTENYRMALKETLKMKWMLNGTGALAEYIGGYYYKLGMPEDAVAELEEADDSVIQNDPGYYHCVLGLCHQLAGHYAAAASEYSKAIDAGYTAEPSIFIRAGVCHEHLGDYSKAMDLYNQVVCQDTPSAYLCRGRIYLEQGHKDLADADFSAVVEKDTVLTEGNDRQFALYFLGRNEEALDWQKALDTRFPDSKEVDFSRACLYSLLNRPEDAVIAMEAAFKHGLVYFNLIDNNGYLDAVRNVPEFKSLVEKYRAKHNAFIESIRKEIRSECSGGDTGPALCDS